MNLKGREDWFMKWLQQFSSKAMRHCCFGPEWWQNILAEVFHEGHGYLMVAAKQRGA